MDNKSIEFVEYLKLSQDSDAFFFSEKFKPFLEIEASQGFSAESLDYNKYTAGTTQNPDDYELPNIENIINPIKLTRINAFNFSSVQNIKTYQFDEKKYLNEQQFTNKINDEQISPDAIRFLSILKKEPEKNIKKNQIDITFNNNNFIEQDFTLSPRSFISEKSSGIIDTINVSNSNSDINEKVISKTEKIEKQNQITNRTQNIFNDIEYDVNNSNIAYFNDFTTLNNTTQVVNEIKNEIINNVNEIVTKLEKKILNETVTNHEMKNIHNNIVNVIESKLNEKESSIIEKIEEKSKKDLNKFKNDFLNS